MFLLSLIFESVWLSICDGFYYLTVATYRLVIKLVAIFIHGPTIICVENSVLLKQKLHVTCCVRVKQPLSLSHNGEWINSVSIVHVNSENTLLFGRTRSGSKLNALNRVQPSKKIQFLFLFLIVFYSKTSVFTLSIVPAGLGPNQ